MSIIIKRTFLLMLISILLILLLVLVNSFLLRTTTSFVIGKSKNLLILGDSLTECAVDDKILNNSSNHSISGQPYIQSYLLLKKYTNANPQIDTVLLSYSDGKLDVTYNDWVILNFYRYLSLASVEDLWSLHKADLLAEAIINFDFVRFFSLNVFKHFFVGGFKPLDITRQTTQASAVVQKKTFVKTEKQKKVLNIQQFYLNKIIEFSNNFGIELILLKTPVYNSQNTIDNFIRDKHPYIKVLDYSQFQLTDESYADDVHLNRKGASTFSKHLNDFFLNK